MMNRIQKCLFLLILLFAAFHVFLGIDCGIPSRERMETELGGKTVLENHLPELEQFLAAGSYERSEFSGETGEEENSARSRFSPFLDQLRSYHPDEQFTLKTISTMVKNRTLQPGAYIYGQFYHYQIASALAAAALAGYLPMDLNTLSGLRNPETAVVSNSPGFQKRSRIAPQVKPPPKAVRSTLSPRSISFPLTISSKQIPIDAAEVLP